MEHIGAGLAALGVFGPGIGIGILAAFAEGLGVLAIVVGLLAIFIK